MYSDIAEFEGVLGTTFDAILHVGDFGIWPDPRRVDRATRRHADDRDLLRCPACGLMEDVLSDGVLVTYHDGSDREDTGLRFAEDPQKDGRFVCPTCGCEVEPGES